MSILLTDMFDTISDDNLTDFSDLSDLSDTDIDILTNDEFLTMDGRNEIV